MIPVDKVREIIKKHEILEKELSSGAIEKKLFANNFFSIAPDDNSFSRISCFFIISLTLSTGIIKFYF